MSTGKLLILYSPIDLREHLKTGQAVDHAEESNKFDVGMVRPAGIEPATLSLEG